MIKQEVSYNSAIQQFIMLYKPEGKSYAALKEEFPFKLFADILQGGQKNHLLDANIVHEYLCKELKMEFSPLEIEEKTQE